MKNVEDIYELSALQWGMLFESLRSPGRGFYVQQHSCVLLGDVDAAGLRDAFESLVQRHGSLRTSFVWQQSERPVQVVFRQVRLPWREVDLSRLQEPSRAVEELLRSDRERDFALDRAPLMRLALLRLGPTASRLVWTHHHAILDGWSVSLAIGELLAARATLREGRPRKEGGSLSYREFIAWLRAHHPPDEEQFWRAALGDLRDPTLVARDLAPSRANQSVRDLRISLDPQASERLQTLARTRRLTLSGIVQAAWALALHTYTGQSDVVFGVVATLRPGNLPQIMGALGLFLNAVPLRFRIARGMTLDRFLEAHRDRPELRQYAHTPLRDIETWIGRPDAGALFDSLLVFESYPQERAAASRTFGFQVVDVTHSERTSYPVSLFVEPGPCLRLRWSFDQHRVEASVMAGLAALVLAALGVFAERTSTRIDDFVRCAPSELDIHPLHSLRIREWNDSAGRLGSQTLVALFAARVRQVPDAVALVFDDHSLTFAELDRRMRGLAGRLRSRELDGQRLIGVCLERSVEAIVAILAILQAGAAYVPIDPVYPQAHLARVVADANLSAVITTADLAERFAGQSVPTVLLNRGERHDGFTPADAPRSAVSESPAYVIYTSGSTGEPKGVLAHHRGAVNRLEWLERLHPLRPGDSCCQTTSLNFVDSVAEIFGALVGGARLVLVADTELRDLSRLLDVIETRGVTRLVLVPSLLDALLERVKDDPKRLAAVSLWVCSGEALDASHVHRFRSLLPEAKLLNLYGSSEVAGDVACQDTAGCSLEDGSIAIGRPIANTELYVLNRHLNVLPVGARGEIYVGGAGLAHGYLRRPAATALAFVPHPFAAQPGERLYRTGDLGRWLCDGSLEFGGRSDRQVKIRGHRVELGAIEAALRGSARVRDAAVICQGDTGERATADPSLVAYVVARDGVATDCDLATALRKELPHYMAPAQIISVPCLPRSPNGKLDQQKLRMIAQVATPPRSHPSVQGMAHTATEAALREIWLETLGTAGADSDATFLSAGGDSLALMRLATRVRRAFDVELPLSIVVENPDLRTLARQIDDARRLAGRGEVKRSLPPLEPVARGQDFPLSLAQQGVWFAARLGNERAYTEQAALRVEGPLALEALRQSAAALSLRHEALRTVFLELAHGPVQRILPRLEIPLAVVDAIVMAESLSTKLEAGTALLSSAPPFSLDRGPLLRLSLLRLSESESMLSLAAHHLVTDGWSGEIIVRELVAHYQAFQAGKPPPRMAELPVQHVDYAVWQQALLDSGALQPQLDHLRAEFSGKLRAGSAPLDEPRFASGHGRDGLAYLEIPRALTGHLKRLAAREGVTLFTALFAAFALVHSVDIDSSEVVIGTDLANRSGVDLENVVGLFVNQAAIRIDLGSDLRLVDLIDRARRALLSARAQQELPFETLTSSLRLEGARGPLFDVKFVLQPQSLDSLRLGELTIQSVALPASAAKFALLCNLYAKDGGLLAVLSYSPTRFPRGRAERCGRHFLGVLERMADAPEASLAAVRHGLSLDDQNESRSRLAAQRTSDRTRLGTIQRRSLPTGGTTR